MSAPEPIPPLAGVLIPGHYGASGAGRVCIALRRASVVELIAHGTHGDSIETSLRAALGLAAPQPGQATRAGDAVAIWSRPGSVLVIATGFAEGALAERLAGGAAPGVGVVDQSHGKAILSLAGAKARQVMAKGCRIDLHPRAFGPGRTAQTQIAHIGCIIYQRDDGPSYDLIVPSTFARAFLDWLTASADEVGYELSS